jgi:hypothetical protein
MRTTFRITLWALISVRDIQVHPDPIRQMRSTLMNSTGLVWTNLVNINPIQSVQDWPGLPPDSIETKVPTKSHIHGMAVNRGGVSSVILTMNIMRSQKSVNISRSILIKRALILHAGEV